MLNKSWYSAAARGNTGEISIYSDIGGFGITAADFAKSLAALGNVKTLNVRINSDGGDISHGTAIFNMLARHKAKKIITVDGIAASMASVILMAGDERIMPRNAMIMIHNPFGGIQGGADQIVAFGEALKVMRSNMIDAYTDATGQSEAEISEMMDRETWLAADEALKLNFATKVVAPQEMAASIDLSHKGFRNTPASLLGSEQPQTIASLARQVYGDDKPTRATPKSFEEIGERAFANFNAAGRKRFEVIQGGRDVES